MTINEITKLEKQEQLLKEELESLQVVILQNRIKIVDEFKESVRSKKLTTIPPYLWKHHRDNVFDFEIYVDNVIGYGRTKVGGEVSEDELNFLVEIDGIAKPIESLDTVLPEVKETHGYMVGFQEIMFDKGQK